MNPAIRTELLRLQDGGRLLRLEHPESGLCLEKRLVPEVGVVVQKQRWRKVFEALLVRELSAAQT